MAYVYPEEMDINEVIVTGPLPTGPVVNYELMNSTAAPMEIGGRLAKVSTPI